MQTPHPLFSWLRHTGCHTSATQKEISGLPLDNNMNKIRIKNTTLPVRSSRLGKGSDSTPRHCSSTGKGMTMRPSASCGKSLMKLLSLGRGKKDTERRTSQHGEKCCRRAGVWLSEAVFACAGSRIPQTQKVSKPTMQHKRPLEASGIPSADERRAEEIGYAFILEAWKNICLIVYF